MNARDTEQRQTTFFPTTVWSVIARAGSDDLGDSRQAFGQLFRSYRRPLEVYAATRGLPPEDAEDAVQGYFTRFLEKNVARDFRPERGRFRTFLLASFKHFLMNSLDSSRALKRGGTVEHISLAGSSPDESPIDVADPDTPELEYEKAWATTVVEHAKTRLREEMEGSGKGHVFAAFEATVDSAGDPPIRELRPKLNMSAGAARVAAHRLRRRYRELIRAEIKSTLADPADTDEELRFLMAVLGR